MDRISFKKKPTVHFRVLVYREDEEWVAHLLEMDLVATGNSPEEAQSLLEDAAKAQISFCLQEGLDPFRNAPPEYFKRWENAQKEALKEEQSTRESRGTILNLTPRDRSNVSRRSQFQLA